jgi:hypothetical protein
MADLMTPTATKTNGTKARQPYLKSRNAGYLWSFVGVNLAVFLAIFITKGFLSSSIEHFWKGLTKKDSIIATCIPLLTIVLNGLLRDEVKARLVFWRWRNPLPGCRVFTELVSSDPRIDVSALRKQYGEFPCEPKEQNILWYRLYKKHIGNVVITEAHRVYLLTRDMTTLSAIFLVFFPIGAGLDSVSWRTECIYAAILIAQYFTIATAARNYGIRFVLNVLAEESQSNYRPLQEARRRKTSPVSEIHEGGSENSEAKK